MSTDTPGRDPGTGKLVNEGLIEDVFIECLLISGKGIGSYKVSWPEQQLDSNRTASKLVPQVPR